MYSTILVQMNDRTLFDAIEFPSDTCSKDSKGRTNEASNRVGKTELNKYEQKIFPKPSIKVKRV